MTITAITKSGSRYELTQKEGKTFIRKGVTFEAEVVKQKQPICVGGIIDLDIYQYNMYMQKQSEISYLRSTKITQIVVVL